MSIFAKLEKGVESEDDCTQVSIAISLKRIADKLDVLAKLMERGMEEVEPPSEEDYMGHHGQG